MPPIHPITTTVKAATLIIKPAILKMIAIPVVLIMSKGLDSFKVQPINMAGISPIRAVTKHQKVLFINQKMLFKFSADKSRTVIVSFPVKVTMPSV